MPKSKGKAAPKRPYKRVLVTSDQINDFIKRHAHEEDNWRSLSARILRELRITIGHSAVSQRGATLGVSTKGVIPRPNRSFAQVDPGQVQPQSELARNVLALVRRRRTVFTVEDLANPLATSPAKIRAALAELKSTGFNVNLAEDRVELSKEMLGKADPVRIDRKHLDGNKFRFLLTGDNHLCNKHERLDVLNALFDIAQDEGITTVYQAGNMIDGDARFNKHEVRCTGLEAQAQYLAEHWPQRKGMTTHFVTGDDHEGWYVNREGVDVGRYLQQTFESGGRSDFRNLGHVEADILLPGKKRQSVLRVLHAGGGSSYATSYAPQKVVESYQGGEKPRVLCYGHHHKYISFYPREIFVIGAGCTVDQTTFLRKNKIAAHVGGVIVELTITEDGDVVRCRDEWIPFYDKGVYTKAWKAARLSEGKRTA